VGVTRIESNRNGHFGLRIESKSIENRNLEIVTSLHMGLCYSSRRKHAQNGLIGTRSACV